MSKVLSPIMSDYPFPPFPLQPIYSSLEMRDYYRRTIYKLFDKNFGKCWKFYIRLYYCKRVMQHRIKVTEIADEEKINLTPSIIENISYTRSAYLSRALDLLKYFYLNDKELTEAEIVNDKFRVRAWPSNEVIITDTLTNISSFDNKKSIDEETDNTTVHLDSNPISASFN